MATWLWSPKMPLLEALKDANIKWSAPVNFVQVARSRAAMVPSVPTGLIDRILGPLEGTVYADAGGA
jgi:hypothetical protein